MCHPRDLLEKEQARLSPSQRDLEMDQVMDALERAIELTPILGDLGFDEKRSFNGLLQVTADGGPSIGESANVRGLRYAVSVWVKDGRYRQGPCGLDDGRTDGNRSPWYRRVTLLPAPAGRKIHS
jgi:hypothetical protein